VKGYISILEEYKEGLNYPGVYRFIGTDPITLIQKNPLYVGSAGIKGTLYKRIMRHLTDNGGLLMFITDNVEFITSIEYWIVNPEDFSSIEESTEVIKLLEQFIRQVTKTYFDRLELTDPKLINIDDIKRNKVWDQVKQIYNNNKNTIDLENFKLPEEERVFQRLYEMFYSIPIRKLIKLRQYKKLKRFMEKFIESWEALPKENYFW
jgi:hypothetical protein